jgi:hypothetical protein
MTRFLQFTMLGLLVLAPTISSQNARGVRSQRNQAPTIQSFTASRSVIDLCPFVPEGSCSSGTIVTLETKASRPDTEATYEYSVSAGAIAGVGSIVNWDLRKARVGKHTATVVVTDQQGRRASATAQVDVVECNTCDPPRSYLTLTCPDEVPQGDIAVFVVTVSGPDRDNKLIYLWSHSNGKRLPGQEGPELKIKAIGSPGDVIKATVEVLGMDPSISRQETCETRIVKLP